jgi:HSP90 family molecular chaperone
VLRFHTSKSPYDLTSLTDYVSRMKPGQKIIYWIAGMSQEEVKKSPFAEKLVAEVGPPRGGRRGEETGWG